jgi:H+-transporting ATPase
VLSVVSAGTTVKGLGLSSREAQERLRRYGPNALPEKRPRPLLLFLHKLWAPVPWMLEATLVLELALGKYTQAVIIVILLLLNAILSFVQEGRARKALALLRQRLTIQARVLHDGLWQSAVAQDLVPGDVIHVRGGDLIPADLALLDGQVLLDQSALTGEATPAEVGPGGTAYAGGMVRRGEATGEVTSTGPGTYYGRTAELVQTAHAPSHFQTTVFAIVKYLVGLDLFLVIAILAYALIGGIPLAEILPFALILLVASVPIALPATYTLATALGSLDLARRGILVTRLSAVEEAAAMDVLCSDKTGTLTENQLTLAGLHAYPPDTDTDVLRLAALACEEATQDPIDLAILTAARQRGLLTQKRQRLRFLPFDPATKRSEALLREGGQTLHVVKGATQVIAALAGGGHDPAADVDALSAQGCRVLAVAAGPEGALQLVGLVALEDPARADSREVVERLADLGIRVLMVTGDGPATAQAVAAQVGIKGRACPAEALRREAGSQYLDCAVFAGVLPEDKFWLVQAQQRAGHVVGMTGDGVNDAPALMQAEVGVAVANATDVAKAAASLVLTSPGLGGVLAAVETGRRVYQRLLTYTLNKMIKTLQVALFLSLGLLLAGVFVNTPRLVLLLLFANDFVTMSLAADRVSFSRRPDRWPIRPLAVSALVLALGWLAFSFAILLLGRHVLRLDQSRLQTLVFAILVFTGQATVYLVRTRGPFWRALPGRWLVLSSVADVLVVSLLASRGILMAAISPKLILGLLLLVGVYLVLLDGVKAQLFRHFDVH